MEKLPQLFMKKASLADLPALSAILGELPADLTLHTHREGEEKGWEDLIERCFGTRYDFKKNVSDLERYHPSHVLYLEKDGVDIAVSAAVQQPTFPQDGWLHFVGVDPSARGRGLAAHIVLATLYSFYAQGYTSVVLSTDDFRIPAIKAYLKLGFVPMMTHESHAARWEAVMQQIEKK